MMSPPMSIVVPSRILRHSRTALPTATGGGPTWQRVPPVIALGAMAAADGPENAVVRRDGSQGSLLLARWDVARIAGPDLDRKGERLPTPSLRNPRGYRGASRQHLPYDAEKRRPPIKILRQNRQWTICKRDRDLVADNLSRR